MIIEDLDDFKSFINLVDKSRKEFIWKDLVKEFRISFTEPLSELSGAFRDTEFNTIDLRGFDTSWVGVMSDLFLNCRSLEKIDLRGLDTSNVSYMAGMFRECHQLKKLDLSDLYFPDVLDLAYMFDGCYSLEELNLPNLNTKNVIYLSKMFRDCKELKEIDLSSFDTCNVRNMDQMFDGCETIRKLDLSKFSTKKVEDMDDIFLNCNMTVLVSKNSRELMELTEDYDEVEFVWIDDKNINSEVENNKENSNNPFSRSNLFD